MAKKKLEKSASTLRQYHVTKEKENVTRFLLILNESNLDIRSQILAMESVLLLGRIYQLTIQEENQWLASS